MKTVVLSANDIETFNKLIFDQGTVQLASGNSGGGRLMALQYYLQNPGNYPVSSQVQLQSLRTQDSEPAAMVTHVHSHQMSLKQPTVHQQLASHHHPYHQHQHIKIVQAPPPAQTSALYHIQAGQASRKNNHTMPVHALNQNSNFSAASSSTGAGTNSSHAPTQQSNTTASSLSPPGATANVRTTAVTQTSVGTVGGQARASTTSGVKKIKSEPVLTQLQQRERLNFANAHSVWNEEHWKRVVFQDERKFNLDGPDGFSYYFHDLRNYERSLSQRPRGNSVYIYMIITAGGPISIEISTTRQRPETSLETVLRERQNIIAKLGGGRGFVLQDLNWVGGVLPTTADYLGAEGIKTQKWPMIAHDLNIMENVWGWLIREVYDGGRKFSRKDDLIFRIREAYTRLPLDLITNLYSTMPERIAELRFTRGIYTNC